MREIKFRAWDNKKKKIQYMFEVTQIVLSETDWQTKEPKFNPNYYVNIEKTFKDKLKASKKYDSEMREYPHSRSYKGIRILAQYRGLECGLKYAEAFKLVRGLNDLK